MSKSLRQFLSEVEDDTVIIKEAVNPKFEITAYVEAFERARKYPVLWFKNVEGKEVVINLFASTMRMGRALGCTDCKSPLEVANRFFQLSQKAMPPIEVKGKFHEIETEDLSELPHIIHNELDGGPYIDSGLTLLKDPENGALNIGIYRHQIFDDKHLGILADPGHNAQYIINKYKEMRKPIPITISIGHHPGVYFAAVLKPKVAGKLEVAGGFLQEPLEITMSDKVGIPYLTLSEIVVEGVIEEPEKLVVEGPFGEWPRYYSGTQNTPVINVKKVRMKKNPIYLDIAAAHKDHLNLGVNLPHLATVYNSVKAIAPYVTNMRFGYDFAPLLYIQIKKINEGDAKRAALAALASEIATRIVVVVDDDIDIYNDEEVMWAILTRTSRVDNFVVLPGVMGNVLNPANYSLEPGKPKTLDNKIIIDATKPISGFPPVAKAPKEIVEKAFEKIKNLLF
jgi:2,5-furandicarboxylate decarboxylase 1